MHLLLLIHQITLAYNRSPFYRVRLIWFPGYIDWERRKHSLEDNEAKRGCLRSEVICTMYIPSHYNILGLLGQKMVVLIFL